ncbi:UNVERIFIED_CONTAM: hypothetical protein FKN15_064515 [Acipenser sinensis]
MPFSTDGKSLLPSTKDVQPPHDVHKVKNHSDPNAMVELEEGSGVFLTNAIITRLTREPKKMTQELMTAVFSREIMAKSSITGKQANSFKTLDPKPQLNPAIVSAICFYVMNQFSTINRKEVHAVIRSKLNNEAKLWKP